MITIKDKNGKEYQFEDMDGYEVYTIRDERIVGSFKQRNILEPVTWLLNGKPAHYIQRPNKLTPFDEYKELKKAHSEGTIIEVLYYGKEWKVWNDFELCFSKDSKYRIKGGISLESWNKHKELIKAWWDGAEIEIQIHDEWYKAGESWNNNSKYRIKPITKKMTVAELEKELGYTIEIVKE